jgi:hypothetical protein
MAALWDISPCNPLETDQDFRRAYCLRHQGLCIIDGYYGYSSQLFTYRLCS